MYFDVVSGTLCCSECNKENSGFMIDSSILSAMRHIVYSEFSKLYSFDLGETNADRLSDITSYYLSRQSDQQFSTLEFYNSIK